MVSLQEIYGRYTTPDGYGDKGTAHSYIEVYGRLFSPLRETARAVLEIGVGPSALSLRMWREYFPHAEIYGIDPCAMAEEALPERTHVLHASGYSESAVIEMGHRQYDVIVDDGSHAIDDQIFVARTYRRLLAPGGILVIEDVANLDTVGDAFRDIAPCKIFDLRPIKGRFDDVLIVYREASGV